VSISATILSYFSRIEAWAIFFGSLWAGFESRFETILKNLAYHSELVDKEAFAAEISNAVLRNEEEAKKWEQQEKEWVATKTSTVLSWLKTDDHLPDDVLERHVRDCLPSSCDWFIQHSRTQMWLKDVAQNAVFWLYGKPGAGQSCYPPVVVNHINDY
jgi:hypothetical protein